MSVVLRSKDKTNKTNMAMIKLQVTQKQDNGYKRGRTRN